MAEIKTLGSTGLAVSSLGLGLAALGRPGYINLGHAADLAGDYTLQAMEQRAHAVLDAAWKEGIRYYDAARSYGRAEHFLASWLKQRQIDPRLVTVGSKWGYAYTADWKIDADKHEVKDHSLATLRRQTADSRTLLGGYLQLYQIHSATLESHVLENHEVLQELTRLRSTGLKIGLSLSGPRQAETLKRALDVRVEDKPLFDCVQATWNLLEQSAGAALKEAHQAGLGVIIKEALANGRLTQRNDNPTFAAKRALLADSARQMQATMDALALAAVLSRPWVHVVLSGAATVEQLLSNLAARRIRWSDALDALVDELAEPAEEYWTSRSRLPWN